MAAVAAHLTRVARVSTHTRVKYAQQYVNNQSEQPSTLGDDMKSQSSSHIADSRLCSTMSRLQFDGYEWDVMEETDTDGLVRRITRKVTMVQDPKKAKEAAAVSSAECEVEMADDAIKQPTSPRTRPKILARFDTEARFLMSPASSRPGLMVKQTNDERGSLDVATATNAKPPEIAMSMATSSIIGHAIMNPQSNALPNETVHSAETNATTEARKASAPVTPILTTRRFREGRSSFMARTPSEPGMLAPM